jgi:hypothetical protein
MKTTHGHRSRQPSSIRMLTLGRTRFTLSGKTATMASTTCETTNLERRNELAAGDNERASNEWIRAQKDPEESSRSVHKVAYSYVYTICFASERITNFPSFGSSRDVQLA